MVQPETVLRWHRRAFAWYWTMKSRQRPGRPDVASEIRDLIRRMRQANPLWGAPRIHGELLKSDTPRGAGGLVSGAASNVKLSVMWSWHVKVPPVATFWAPNFTFICSVGTAAIRRLNPLRGDTLYSRTLTAGFCHYHCWDRSPRALTIGLPSMATLDTRASI